MSEKPDKASRINRKALIAGMLILIAIPATIYAGVVFMDDRKYYFISMLIVIYSLIPFFMTFEGRKPQAREIIIVAVLTAIAVAGRAAFFMLPQFKPVTAIVIIAGVSFGAEAGFLVGSMTALVSNFFFGMGPFTPWQMFCLGLIGFLAGLLAKKGYLKKTKTALCIFGGLSAFILFGLIMDFSSVIMLTQEITKESAAATFMAGLAFNLMHSAATVFFLLAFAKPMIDKVERIKIKYGLMEQRDE